MTPPNDKANSNSSKSVATAAPVTNFNGIGRNGALVLAVFVGLGLGFAIFASWVATQTTTEYRVMLNHQMYLENQIENLKEKLDALRSK